MKEEDYKRLLQLSKEEFEKVRRAVHEAYTPSHRGLVDEVNKTFPLFGVEVAKAYSLKEGNNTNKFKEPRLHDIEYHKSFYGLLQEPALRYLQTGDQSHLRWFKIGADGKFPQLTTNKALYIIRGPNQRKPSLVDNYGGTAAGAGGLNQRANGGSGHANSAQKGVDKLFYNHVDYKKMELAIFLEISKDIEEKFPAMIRELFFVCEPMFLSALALYPTPTLKAVIERCGPPGTRALLANPTYAPRNAKSEYEGSVAPWEVLSENGTNAATALHSTGSLAQISQQTGIPFINFTKNTVNANLANAQRGHQESTKSMSEGTRSLSWPEKNREGKGIGRAQVHFGENKAGKNSYMIGIPKDDISRIRASYPTAKSDEEACELAQAQLFVEPTDEPDASKSYLRLVDTEFVNVKSKLVRRGDVDKLTAGEGDRSNLSNSERSEFLRESRRFAVRLAYKLADGTEKSIWVAQRNWSGPQTPRTFARFSNFLHWRSGAGKALTKEAQEALGVQPTPTPKEVVAKLNKAKKGADGKIDSSTLAGLFPSLAPPPSATETAAALAAAKAVALSTATHLNTLAELPTAKPPANSKPTLPTAPEPASPSTAAKTYITPAEFFAVKRQQAPVANFSARKRSAADSSDADNADSSDSCASKKPKTDSVDHGANMMELEAVAMLFSSRPHGTTTTANQTNHSNSNAHLPLAVPMAPSLPNPAQLTIASQPREHLYELDEVDEALLLQACLDAEAEEAAFEAEVEDMFVQVMKEHCR